MKLTKKQAVEEHRKMWNWIADEIEKGNTESPIKLKRKYIASLGFGINEVYNYCFCCEYVNGISDRLCNVCPLIWPGENSLSCNDSLYERIIKSTDQIEKVSLAHEIANLPEREDKIFDILEEENETTEKTDL